MKTLLSISLGLAALVPVGARAGDMLADDVLGNLYAMKTIYRAEYAPAAWKKQFAGYDLNTQFAKSVAAVEANQNMSIADSREIFKDFIFAMKDYHTSIFFRATESATLPFVVQGTKDHFYFVYIDRTKLPESSFPFQVGDELVTFGGQTTAAAVAEVQNQIIGNVYETDKRTAETRLTTRRAARGLKVPQGPITLGIRAKGSDKFSEIQLVWEYTAETIFPRKELSSRPLSTEIDGAAKRKSGLFNPEMSVKVETGSIVTAFDLGARKTFTPSLGLKIWESADTSEFHAYIYQSSDHKLIGYLRLPSYSPADKDKAVADFAAIIEKFETTTDSMVIDQVNNPGGSVFYLYALASMLSEKPLIAPRHRMAVTQADVAEALTTIEDLKNVKNDEEAKKALGGASVSGYPASYEFAQFMLNYSRFLVSEWNAGRKLTTPYWIAGVDHINPAATVYTKPILLLINQMDFSGGDFFPTILQDNKRVTIMGTRTAGAGGYVVDVDLPNNVGIEGFRVTESIAERVDGNPIENLGVKPEINYSMTDEDFQTGFQPYAKAVRATILSITQ